MTSLALYGSMVWKVSNLGVEIWLAPSRSSLQSLAISKHRDRCRAKGPPGKRSKRLPRLLVIMRGESPLEAGIEKFLASQGGAEVGYRGAVALFCIDEEALGTADSTISPRRVMNKATGDHRPRALALRQ